MRPADLAVTARADTVGKAARKACSNILSPSGSKQRHRCQRVIPLPQSYPKANLIRKIRQSIELSNCISVASRLDQIQATAWKCAVKMARFWEKRRSEIAKTFATPWKQRAKQQAGQRVLPTIARRCSITWQRTCLSVAMRSRAGLP